MELSAGALRLADGEALRLDPAHCQNQLPLEHTVRRLSLIATHDDLLLDGRVIEDVPLMARP